MVRDAMISYWLAAFGAHDILVIDTYMRFIGKIFQDFGASRNIAVQTAIPGHHQSSGATERRRGHLRLIIDHIIGKKREANCLVRKKNGKNFRKWQRFI